jgi:hypothetical protein
VAEHPLDEEELALAEMRRLLGADRGPGGRLERLEPMERAAQVWVNGRALGAPSPNSHLYETYD